jgi:hypothetical protein
MLKSCDCNKEEDDCLDIKINSTSFNIYPLPCHSKILDEVHSQNFFLSCIDFFVSTTAGPDILYNIQLTNVNNKTSITGNTAL